MSHFVLQQLINTSLGINSDLPNLKIFDLAKSESFFQIRIRRNPNLDRIRVRIKILLLKKSND